MGCKVCVRKCKQYVRTYFFYQSCVFRKKVVGNLRKYAPYLEH